MALLMLAVLLLPLAWRERKPVKIAELLFLIGAGIFASAVCHFWLPGEELASQLVRTFKPTRLLSPFLAGATGHLNSDFAKIAAQSDVPKSELAAYPETDLYSYNQMDLFVHPFKYRPRPIPQSYSAYTPELAQMNAVWLRSSQAAGELWFAVQPLDDRFPSLDDGLSWPEIWTRYEPSPLEMTYNPYLLLHRRREPRSYLCLPITNFVARLGDTVTVPKSDQELIWTEVDVRQSLAGKMVTAIYKPPIVFMTVTFPDHSSHRYRLVPGMARAGFLLSPVMSDNRAFGAMYFGNAWQSELAGKEVVSIKVEPEAGSYAYEPEFNVRFSRLEISGR
jgi:hypothetical protein